MWFFSTSAARVRNVIGILMLRDTSTLRERALQMLTLRERALQMLCEGRRPKDWLPSLKRNLPSFLNRWQRPSPKGEIAMDMKKLVVVSAGLVAFGFLVVAASEAGETKVIKSKASGGFVSANFDFDHPDLSTPAGYINGEGISNAGKFTSQFVDESAPDGKTCTVPGRGTDAATEFKLVGDVGVFRFAASGDLLFLKSTSGTECADFSAFPTPPFPVIQTETGIITGGTGKYSGATGTFTFDDKGAFLSLDATGQRGFGWFEDTAVMTVTVP